MAEYNGVAFPEPEVRLTNFELQRVLEGHPMRVETTEGQEITLRLSTVDELLESARVSREKLPEAARPPEMDRGMAIVLTTPVWIS